MKKISIAMAIIMMLTMLFATIVLATEAKENTLIIGEMTNLSNASETTLENLTTKEEKIAYYTEKYGDETEGRVAYWISIAQKYSIPVFFLLLIWGALNFFIIGNKKLQQREKGFSIIIGSIIGAIVFQAIPLIYAIFVAGR
ncbi:MAG: hypothetical protein IKK43_03445 [Clostridia bacterium]|nr:hypothetical protein [Clostridia bacterium]